MEDILSLTTLIASNFFNDIHERTHLLLKRLAKDMAGADSSLACASFSWLVHNPHWLFLFLLDTSTILISTLGGRACSKQVCSCGSESHPSYLTMYIRSKYLCIDIFGISSKRFCSGLRLQFPKLSLGYKRCINNLIMQIIFL